MSETKIEMKLEEETKSLKKVCEKLEEVVKHQFDGGIEQIDTKEMGEVIDMWKDLCEAKEKIVKSCYYTYILKAMEKEENEDEDYKKIMEKMRMSGDTEEDDMERRYYDNYRYANGRFAPKGSGTYRGRGSRRGYAEPPYYHMTPEMYREHDPEYYRDMDRMSGKMYYTETSPNRITGQSSNMNNMRDSREGRSGQSRRSYIETKEMHSDNSPESKQVKMRELEKYMGELSADLTEMIAGASNEEKTMLKTKLQTLTQKIQ